jgi:amino acid adenylation domain-containing protein
LPVSQLQLLSEAELRFLLRDCNHTAADVPSLCLHQLFEQQVERTPDAVALVYQEEQLTYAELNARANRLAHHLLGVGVGADSLVGILMGRSLEMVISLLAVLKAGGAYLPLDPAYPAERLSFMIADAGARVLLTKAGEPELVRAKEMVQVGERCECGCEQRDRNPGAAVDAENLAYVIYTSGSTGLPKGVMIPHRAGSAFILSASEAYAITSTDRVLQFASFSFDTSVEEIFPCLTRGARLVLRTEQMLTTAADFLRQCATLQLSVLDLPTSYWHQLTAQMSEEALAVPPGVRLVIIGGESAAREPVLQWQQSVQSSVRLVNTYGPTEATVVATVGELATEVAELGVAIGRGLPHVKCYVLDEEMKPVPIGVKGELYVGGEGVGRGYFGRAELTADRFVPDPYTSGSSWGGERLYRTGDEVRWRESGELEFVGRVDNQVKVRGYRIELGEVEAVLSRQQAVQECAVALREEAAGEKRLIGYVVTEDTTDLDHLREQLRAQLPDYMVPSVLVKIADLPRLPNGKVNRRALAALEVTRTESQRLFVAPRTPLEEELAAIWQQLLKVEQVGVYDNFFNLGGHSLLLTQLVSRIRSAFRIDLQLRELFSAPTLEENVKLIALKQIEQEDAAVVAQLVEDLKHLSADEIKSLLEAEGSLAAVKEV